MKAVLEGHVIAESNDIVETGGYHYFPGTAVRRKWFEKAPKTDSDRACPHGVQFYDVVIDGPRPFRNGFEPRSAVWSTSDLPRCSVQPWPAIIPMHSPTGERQMPFAPAISGCSRS